MKHVQRMIAVSIMMVFMVSVLGCGGKPAEDAAPTAEPPSPEKVEKISVYVSLPPQAYFVERLGGELVEVGVLVGPGQSPHTFQPTPKQMGELGRTRVFFRIGLPFENALLPKIKALNPKLSILDTRRGIKLRDLEEHHHEGEEEHEEAGEEAKDPHIWLDPKLAMVQAGTMAEELARLDPAHRDVYQRNLVTLLTDLRELDARTIRSLAPYYGRTFLVFHPAYGYFAEAYGLRQLAVETEGKAAKGRDVAAWVDTARREGLKVVYVEPQFNKTTAETIAAEIGAAIVPLDPLARDYPANLEAIAAGLADGFRREDESR